VGGEEWDGALNVNRALSGGQASRMSWLGLIPKPQVYAVLRRAEVAVIPSWVDNLANTVIESVLFHIPVIGSRGASMDELIEPGKTGELVPMGQPAALADALVRAWRRDVPWRAGQFSLPAIIDQMKPRIAAMNVLRLAGHPQ
jgi:glycosyltransferase involved in cell wall biosynthesis